VSGRRIAISGATGLVGTALANALRANGDAVIAIGRAPRKPEDVRWDPERGEIEHDKLESLDAVVHLAGENIADGRWTARKKAKIASSRVQGTRLVAQTLAKLKQPPPALVSASASGFYGDRGDMIVDHTCTAGTGFLAEVCQSWEAAALPANAVGIRICHPRIGIVLTPSGGALKRMLLPFRLGLGGRLGSGRQWVSWISLADLVTVLMRSISDPELRGPFDAVTQNPVTNAEFTRVLARVLHRPAFLPVPRFALRILLGEMAGPLVFTSCRVQPKRLVELGHRFATPSLEEALVSMIGKE